MSESLNIILFDGYCNVCSALVQFVIRHDRSGHFRFMPLQSAGGKELLQRHNVHDMDMDSVVLITAGKAYTRSDGMLHIFRDLGGLWPALYLFIVTPRFLRDYLYHAFARRRYRWFGRKEECMIPTAEIRDRFLTGN